MTWESAQSALWKRSPSHVPDRARQHTKTQKNNVTMSNGSGFLRSAMRMSLTQQVDMKVCCFQIKGDQQQDEITASTAKWALGPLCTISPATYICVQVQPIERDPVLTSQQFTQTSPFHCPDFLPTPLWFASLHYWLLSFLFHFHQKDVKVWAGWAQLG